MAETYAFVDIKARGGDAVATAFANQVAYCEMAQAPVTGRVCAALGALLASDAPGAVLERARAWPGAPIADALPLRMAGAIHALHLSGAEPALGAVYDPDGTADPVPIIAAALLRHEAALLPWLDGPPQTNEAGRSANFIAAMLWLAEQGLFPRFECLEIGSSAGINLMLARYGYDLAGVEVGPQPGVMRFVPEWQGNPPPARDIEIVSTRGCDVAPVDLSDPVQALRLKAFIWPEQLERFARMDAAIREVERDPPSLIEMSAADFVEVELAKPQAAGTTRVLMHSIVWQYVPEDQQRRVTEAMEAAGAKATSEQPLAWIALEANRTIHRHELVVRYWPEGGEPHLLALSHPHGAAIAWQV